MAWVSTEAGAASDLGDWIFYARTANAVPQGRKVSLLFGDTLTWTLSTLAGLVDISTKVSAYTQGCRVG